jgi:phosphoserine phosphatase RsbU/P
MFIGILGHDLRTPLSAIITSAAFMLDLDELAEPHLTLTSRIASSSRRMQGMVADLLDLTRSRLGGGIPVSRKWMDLKDPLSEVVDEHLAMHPGGSIEVNTAGDLRGQWDRERLSQVLSNLIHNALEHRAHESPVAVNVHGAIDTVTIAIHNHGTPIPASLLPRIFDPMKRRDTSEARARPVSSNLGLGLYIAERIVTAHGGRIEVSSSASAGTTFTVSLPRAA